MPFVVNRRRPLAGLAGAAGIAATAWAFALAGRGARKDARPPCTDAGVAGNRRPSRCIQRP